MANAIEEFEGIHNLESAFPNIPVGDITKLATLDKTSRLHELDQRLAQLGQSEGQTLLKNWFADLALSYKAAADTMSGQVVDIVKK